MFAGLENHAIHYLLSVGAYAVENKQDKGNIKRFPRFLGKDPSQSLKQACKKLGEWV